MERNHHDNEASSINSQTAQETAEINLIAQLKPAVFIDGNNWCFLYGKNLQDGVAGFGVSPHEAAMDFSKNWYKKLV